MVYRRSEAVPQDFFAKLYTRRQVHAELETLPMELSARVFITKDFELRSFIKSVSKAQLRCLHTLRFGRRGAGNLLDFRRVTQDDMRKLEGLKNIEFVGIDISDDIKSALIKHTKTIYKFKQLKPNIKFVLYADMEEDNGMGLIVTV